MILPGQRFPILVATKPVDFRKGHNGLAALVQNGLQSDPFTGAVFVFRSRVSIKGTPSVLAFVDLSSSRGAGLLSAR